MKIGSINYQLFIYKSKTNRKGLAPIYCKLFYRDQLKIISSGIKVNPSDWDNNKYQIVNDALKSNILELWKQKLHKQLLDIYSHDHEVNLQQIANLLLCKPVHINTVVKTMGYIEVYNLYITQAYKTVGEQLQKRTVQKYITVCNSFKDFVKQYYNTKDIGLSDLRLKHLLEYEEFCLSVLKHKQVTINKSVQLLKQIIKYALGREYVDKDPWLLHKSKNVTTTIVYLTKDQLACVENAVNLTEKLTKVRDCFIFSCYSGLAYAEIASLSKENIIVKNGITWITMKRQKTHKNFLIPLLPPAQIIWNKYEGDLPVLSNQKYNAYLKELAISINLTAHLTTHLARKTFTTTVLLGNNIPLKVASTLLGHSNTKITEKHYAEVTNDLLDQHVSSLFEIFSK